MDDSLDHQWSEPRVAAFFRAHPDRVPPTSSFVPAGWDKAVADALTSLLDLERATGTALRITQIKEELGGLRIYVDVDETPAGTHLRSSATPGSVRERMHAILDQAAARADFCCIRCGAPITHRDRLYRVCAAHRQPMPRPRGS